MMVVGLAVGLLVLYDSFPLLTARLERLRLLLTASNSGYCIAHTYLIQPLLMSVGFPKEINAALE